MTRLAIIGVIVASATVFGCTSVPPDWQVLVEAAEAMGGEEAVRDATSLVMQGRGLSYRVGQKRNPAAEIPFYDVSEYTQAIDLANARLRTEIVRSTAFYTSSPARNERLISGLDGAVAFNVNAKGEQQRANDDAARDRRAELYHHPLSLIRLALTVGSGTTVSNVRQEAGHQVVDVKTAGGETFTMYVNSETKLPAKITSAGYNPNLGDVTMATEFDDYGESDRVSGSEVRLVLPRTIKSSIDGHQVADWYVASRVNAELPDLAASDAVKGATPPVFRAKVDVTELAPGVWALAGQSHNSVVVEFPKFAVLIEAPQNDERARAVIAKARELVPNKPLQYVINTHHHFDHSGGVRAAVAEGLTLVTHENNRAFYEEMTKRPHTIRKDHLAEHAQPLKIEVVKGDDVYTIKDGSRVLEVYRVTGDVHADDLVMVYLPAERIVVEADAFHPDTAEAPFAANLYNNIQERKLRVDRIVAIHGSLPTPIGRLEEAAKKFPARTGGGPANHPQQGKRAQAST